MGYELGALIGLETIQFVLGQFVIPNSVPQVLGGWTLWTL